MGFKSINEIIEQEQERANFNIDNINDSDVNWLLNLVWKNNKESGNKLLTIGQIQSWTNIVFNSEMTKIRELLTSPATIEVLTENKCGWILFWLAIEKRDIAILKLLLALNINPNFKNDNGGQILLFAVDNNDVDSLEILVSAKFNINFPDQYGNCPLAIAAIRNSLPNVTLLLAAGANFNAPNKFGETSLMLACIYGYSNIVASLINAGADINARNNDGTSALMIACTYGYSNIVASLINAGADINAQNNAGKTALILTTISGNNSIFKQLLNANANIRLTDNKNKGAFFHACMQKQYKMVVKLWECGADVNAHDNNRTTVLMQAVINQDLLLFNFLLAKNCDITFYNWDGETVLNFAAGLEDDNFEDNSQEKIANPVFLNKILAIITEKGWDINKLHKNYSNSPLINAVLANSFIKVKILLEHGIAANYQDKYNKKALDYAIEKKAGDIVFLLLAHVNLAQTKYQGNDILTWAFKCRNVELITTIINYSVNINYCHTIANIWLWAAENGHVAIIEWILVKAENFNINFRMAGTGTSALSAATFFGQEAVVKTLLAAGADINIINIKKETPLIMAAQKQEVAIAKLLLAKNVDVNACDIRHMTALMHAAAAGNVNMVLLLLAHDANVTSHNIAGHNAYDIAKNNCYHQVTTILTNFATIKIAVLTWANKSSTKIFTSNIRPKFKSPFYFLTTNYRYYGYDYESDIITYLQKYEQKITKKVLSANLTTKIATLLIVTFINKLQANDQSLWEYAQAKRMVKLCTYLKSKINSNFLPNNNDMNKDCQLVVKYYQSDVTNNKTNSAFCADEVNVQLTHYQSVAPDASALSVKL